MFALKTALALSRDVERKDDDVRCPDLHSLKLNDESDKSCGEFNDVNSLASRVRRSSIPTLPRPTSEVSEISTSASSSSSDIKFDMDSNPISRSSSRLSMNSILSNRRTTRSDEDAGKTIDNEQTTNLVSMNNKEDVQSDPMLDKTLSGSRQLKRSTRTISHRSESSLHDSQPPRLSRRRGTSTTSKPSVSPNDSPVIPPRPKHARRRRPSSITTPPRTASRCLTDVPVSSPGFFEELGASAESYIGLDDAFWSSNATFKALNDSTNGSLLSVKLAANTTSLAVELAERGCDVVRADGRSLWEIEECVSSETSHLVLSGCRDPALFDLLERVLPGMAGSLLVLDLSSTSLHELPNCLQLCTKLEELNLSNNPALQAPSANLEVIARLGTSLQLLNLDNCQLTILPGALMNLSNLRILSACGNQLAHLPAWLHRLGSLQRLMLAENPFQGPWTSICEEFCKPTSSSLAMTFDGASASSQSSLRTTDSSANTVCEQISCPGFKSDQEDERLEELLDEPSAPDSPISGSSLNLESSRSRTFKPFVRRMLSAGDLKGVLEEEKKASMLEAESKWATLRRKINGKSDTSTSQLGRSVNGASSSQTSLESCGDTTSSGSGSSLAFMPKAIRSRIASRGSKQSTESKESQNLPARNITPVERMRRISFLPFGPISAARQSEVDMKATDLAKVMADEDAKHRKSVRVLLQYLEDLSDLNPVQRNLNIYLNRSSNGHDSSSSSVGHSSASHRRQSHSLSPSMSSVYSDVGSEASKAISVDAVRNGGEQGATFKDDAKRRLHIIREILATEMTYIRNLRELVDLYVVPAGRLDPVTHVPPMPLLDRRQVFGNIEGILHFHSEAFAPALHESAMCALEASTPSTLETDSESYEAFQRLTIRAAEQVARTFDRHAAFFRMYAAYVNNVDVAQKRIVSWNHVQATTPGTVLRSSTAKVSKRETGQESTTTTTSTTIGNGVNVTPDCSASLLSPKERKRLRLFLQQARSDKRHSQLSLEAYIHLPVQRIPRYRLLLEDLVRVCPPERMSMPDSIQTALDSMSSIASMMNESKRQSEMDRRLLYWQERIRGSFPSPLVQPHRKLINDGALTLCRIVTRAPSFTIGRDTLLGDTNGLDSYEESMLLRFADVQYVEPNVTPATAADANHELQISHLERQQIDRRVQLVLCNDITVIVGEEQSGPVDLLAVLRVTGPARIINDRILRITDPKHILYFEASSRQEAENWKRALTMTASTTPSAGQTLAM